MTLQTLVSHWAENAIPERTPMSALQKLSFEELPELVRAISNNGGSTTADCMILLLDCATLLGIDVEVAVDQKIEQNRKRAWIKNPDTGFYNHL